MSKSTRRLAAIMFTDMVGYTALGQRNESLSLALVEEQRKLIRPILSRHDGREVKTIGDAFLVEFPNATDSVRCAYDIQRVVREFNLSLASDKRIHLRIGLHLGEVVESQGDISGDAVNVASRIQPLAEDGGVCLTRQVYDQVSNKVELQLTSIGAKPLKNVSTPIEVYKIVMPWEQPPPAETATYPTNRIAILPFASFSSDPDDAYFADGVTDEIISAVAGISGLSVISRTSVIGYKGTTKKVKEIGRELEVGSVLEGTFKKAGSKIRVTTQLINVAEDRHLWAQNYDRDLDDVFAVQSDVAKQVADALRVKILSPELERVEKRPTESTSAYSLYLKGRFHWNKRGIEDVKKAMEYFELAVHEDPGFALGFDGLADCHGILAANWNIETEANNEKSRQLVAKALEVDSGLAEAHASNARQLMGDYRWSEAEREFKKTIELKPSYASAHHWYFLLLIAQMRMEEALSHIERAAELDPLSAVINVEHGYFYFVHRDYAKALQLYERAVRVDPKSAIARSYCAGAYAKLGRIDDARREFGVADQLLRDSFPLSSKGTEATLAYASRDEDKLKRLLPELESHRKEIGMSALDIAGAYFYLGEVDKGFEWLEKSYSAKEFFIVFMRNHDFLDGVRTDPRYLDLLKKLGLD